MAWLPQDGSPTAGMSEHIILATLPGQAVSAVTFTAPSEPVLGQALTDNGDYLADWSDCAGQPERFNARWREAWRLLFTASWRRSACGTAPLVAAPGG